MVRRVFAGYLVVQALAGVAWWAALFTLPTLRAWFEPMAGHPEVMDAFVFADFGVVVVGSVATAHGLLAGARWVAPAAAFTAGGLVYATVYLVGWVSFTGTGAPILAVMVPPTVFTAWIGAHVAGRTRHPA